MQINCCIKNCSSNKFNTVNCKFYSFPRLWSRTPRLKYLSEERRRQWLAAINRKQLNTEIARVCSRHFFSGKNAKLWDKLNPDWVPSLHLSYETKRNSELVVGRFERQNKRNANKVLREIQNVECTDQPEAIPAEEMLHEVTLEEETYPEEEYLEEYLDEINPANEPSFASIGQPVARAATYSSYKSTETVKYMIGIAPSGAVIYTSMGYGGRSSDKFIAENSDFLKFLKPKDIVLSDRGFLIHEAVRSKGAELKMPAFMEGRLQLDPIAVEDSKKFGSSQDPYRESNWNVAAKVLNPHQHSTFDSHFEKNIYANEMCMDAIVLTCCALLNLSPSVVNHTLNIPD